MPLHHQPNTEESKILKHLLAGGLAGAISRTCVSPLERVKILFQLQRPGQVKYRGVWHALVTIFKEEGLYGYLRGNGTNIIRIFPYSAVQFAAYEQFKKLLKVKKDSGPLRFLSAGAGAGITSVVATYPLDLIRTRLSSGAAADKQYKGIWQAFINIVRTEGPLATYKGVVATVLVSVICSVCHHALGFAGLNFATYEVFKRFCSKQFPNVQPSAIHLTCGAVAGAVSQTVTYPLDVLRRRMQMQGFDGHPAYTSTWDCTRSMWRLEGVNGFYRGMIPNYLKVVPSISITFLVYEWMKTVLDG
ncbi:Mitochondrial carrier protein [Acanthamoeba castellanii str. Neff]|uniref:Mitochondrial carrier protein n=1 Tax=Acanthamoeba castellanii (strain ATCC 30010 / Neff) TaxID=1257118 RepID=L8GSF8_ACACF|nr:Mitochondrial carrier protein [Acanthamoeba castellanii str. Neff]ELR16099.1 Mitochondrial carrier protein [Acanthamoeba castellanii str. Neff]